VGEGDRSPRTAFADNGRDGGGEGFRTLTRKTGVWYNVRLFPPFSLDRLDRMKPEEVDPMGPA